MPPTGNGCNRTVVPGGLEESERPGGRQDLAGAWHAWLLFIHPWWFYWYVLFLFIPVDHHSLLPVLTQSSIFILLSREVPQEHTTGVCHQDEECP